MTPENPIKQATRLIEEADQHFSLALTQYKLWKRAHYWIGLFEANIEEIQHLPDSKTPQNIQDIKSNQAYIEQQIEMQYKAVERWTDPLLKYIEKFEKAYELCEKVPFWDIPQDLQKHMIRLDSSQYIPAWMLWKSVKMMYDASQKECERAVNAENMTQFDERFMAYSRKRGKFRSSLILLNNRLKALPLPTVERITMLEEEQAESHLECQKRADEVLMRILAKK